MELLKTLVPGVSRVGVLNSGNYVFHEEAWRAAHETARALKLTLVDVRVGRAEDMARLICHKTRLQATLQPQA
jgi:ABC-type uncharacterized transport system substrate-binding protein